MRHHRFIITVLGVLYTAPAFAQSYPAEAEILHKEVDVRSGPGTNFFETSRLKQGDKVIVIRQSKESPGWLEIKPPLGSFSWINGKYVKQVNDRLGYVEVDPGRPAPVLPGSRLVNQAPNREIIHLTAGTIVVIVERPQTANNETWLPIEPHPSEVRYIPAEAVRPATQVTTTTSPPNWTLGSTGYFSNPMLADAEQAVKAGDINRARQLYQHVVNTTNDQNQKTFALDRLSRLPQTATAPVQATATSAQRPIDPTTVNSSPPAPNNLVTTKAPAWSQYGQMRETTLPPENGQPIYVLEDKQGRPLSYVTTIPGKSLRDYIGRTVAVYGPTMYRSDRASRFEYIVASHVALP